MASRSRDTWLKVLVVKCRLPERRYSIVWIGPNSRSTSCWRRHGFIWVSFLSGSALVTKFTGSRREWGKG